MTNTTHRWVIDGPCCLGINLPLHFAPCAYDSGRVISSCAKAHERAWTNDLDMLVISAQGFNGETHIDLKCDVLGGFVDLIRDFPDHRAQEEVMCRQVYRIFCILRILVLIF